MKKVLRREHVYPDPPEHVWVALTDPRALAEWLMPNNFKPVVGHRFRFQTDRMGNWFSGITECEVLECDPPRRLSYTWTIVPAKSNEPLPPPTIVSWTLTPEAGGTRLVFEHTGLEHVGFWHRLSMAFGWGTMHKRWIPKVLRHVGPDGAFSPGAIPLHKRCYKCKTIPAEMVR